MKTLQGLLNDALGTGKRKAPRTDKGAYNAFRKLARKEGFSYKVDRVDGFIDIEPFGGFPKGISTAHYNWPETLERVEYVLKNPETLDADGCYSE